MNENVTFNFARFLDGIKRDGVAAAAVLLAGINDNPESGRLHLLRGELSLMHGDGSQALESLRRAREKAPINRKSSVLLRVLSTWLARSWGNAWPRTGSQWP